MDPLDPQTAALATDLDGLSSAAVHFRAHPELSATFELGWRPSGPGGPGVLIAAGLEQAVGHLLELRFEDDQLGFLSNLFALKATPPEFWTRLKALRFSGDVWALPEGTPCLPGEPLLRLTAPIVEAELVRAYLTAVVGFSTLVATWTARCLAAAGGREIRDDGGVTAHAPGSAVLAARASYIAGAAGGRNLEAAWALGVPLYGGASPSAMACAPDLSAGFAAVSAAFAGSCELPLDGLDEAQLLDSVRWLGVAARGVRRLVLGPPDLGARAAKVRALLDAEGLGSVQLVARGALDEAAIAALVAAGAPLDAFALGRELLGPPGVANPTFRFELVATGDEAAASHHEPGARPGPKQVFRRFDAQGLILDDTLALAGEPLRGTPLLRPVIRGGALAFDRPGLETIRAYARRALATLPDGVLRGTSPAPPVSASPALEQLAAAPAVAPGEQLA